MKNNMMSELPPAYRPASTATTAPSQQVYRIEQSALPEFLRGNRALEEHFARVGAQRAKIIKTNSRVGQNSEFQSQPPAPRAYHYSNAWEDQSTMNDVVSFDFRIESIQNSAQPCVVQGPAQQYVIQNSAQPHVGQNSDQPYVVSKEEQLAIATRFLSKLDRVIAQSEKALQR